MGVVHRIVDGLRNAITGVGTTADSRRGIYYAFCPLTGPEIDAVYRGSGLMRKVIDIPAFDMVREWRDWQAEKTQIEAIEAEERRLSIQAKVLQAEILRGLGGGALILGAPGNPDSPIPATIGKGSLAYVHVISRWQITLGPMIEDPTDALYGGPAYFEMMGTSGQLRFHPSRIVCFKADPLPNMTGTSWEEQFWGETRVQRVREAVQNFDTATAAFASMLNKAKLTRIGMPGLSELASTTEGEAIIKARVATMMLGESTLNATLYESGAAESAETITDFQMVWTGIPDVIRVEAEAVAAVADIPMTRLWGKSAEGMSASGQSQQTDWNKMVKARQNLFLRPCLDQLDGALITSALGTKPKGVWYAFAPLDTPTEAEETTRFKIWTEAAEKVQNSGTIPDIAFAKAYQNSMSENGWMPGLDGALAEVPEAERFGLSPEPDDTDPSELKGGDPDAGERGDAPPARRAANDAWMTEDWAAKPLYVRRDVINRADIVKWATAQGFTDIVSDLHVTITYSTQPVDWMTMGESWRGKLEVDAGGPRLVEALGPDGKYKALLFTAYELISRNQEMRDKGASFDWPEYQPHITIQVGGDVDLATVKPYTGKIVLGPEIFEEIRG